MLDITNSFIKSGMGWRKKRERGTETEEGGKVTNKFSEKSFYSVTSLPQSHLGHGVYKLSWQELSLVFDDILNPLPFEKVNYRSHSVKAQVKTRKGKPTRLKLPSAMNSSSQIVFLGTLGLHGGGTLRKKQGREAGFSFTLEPELLLYDLLPLFGLGGRKLAWKKSFKRCKKKVIWRLLLLRLSQWRMRSQRSYLRGSSCQCVWCFGVTFLLMKKDAGALCTGCKWGCCQAPPASRVPARRADRLVTPDG